MSNSASGLSDEELCDAEDLEDDDLGDGEGEGEAVSEEGEGVGDDLCFARAEGEGLADGVGEASEKGLTGPVGFRGAAGVGFGKGEGEGAAKR